MSQSSESPVPTPPRSGTGADESFLDPPSLAPTQNRAASSLTWIGRIVAGRFEIRRCLARGSMGRVFLAIQHPLGREVAVKVLETRENLEDGAAYEERFLMEASVLARLSHPNTVRVFDYGTWEGRLYLVMEYVEGDTLRSLLKLEGRLEAERAIRLCTSVAASLQEAHDEGVVHRDLKPGNILVQQRPNRLEKVKVVDFGLVKEVDPEVEVTGSGLLMGTPRYMSPEQIQEDGVDGRADIYALGVVLFRCLTGHLPFPLRTAPALLSAHLNTPVPAFRDVEPGLELPPVVEWTVRRCLEKRPKDRFRDAGELIAALDACRVALQEPDWFHVELALVDGVVVSPFERGDALASSRSLSASRSLARAVPERRSPSPLAMMAFAGGVLLLLAGGGALLMLGIGPWGAPRQTGPVRPDAVVEPITPAVQAPDGEPTPGADPSQGAGAVLDEAPDDTQEVEPSAEPVEPTPPRQTRRARPRPPRAVTSGRNDEAPAPPDEGSAEPSEPSEPSGVEARPTPESGTSDLRNPFER